MEQASNTQQVSLYVQNLASHLPTKSIAKNINETMQGLIRQHGLEVLERYPKDVTVHDLAFLEWAAKPGAVIAWMVGHCHSHIVLLGLSQKENQNVTYLTNLASEDRFYVIKVDKAGVFTFKELDRTVFADLSNTPVPYKREGEVSDFWLTRNDSRVGHIHVDKVGDWQELRYQITATPVAGITELDLAALNHWCNQSAVEAAHSLFVSYEVIWAKESRNLLAA